MTGGGGAGQRGWMIVLRVPEPCLWNTSSCEHVKYTAIDTIFTNNETPPILNTANNLVHVYYTVYGFNQHLFLEDR